MGTAGIYAPIYPIKRVVMNPWYPGPCLELRRKSAKPSGK
jgi:hypothetical protein